MPENAKEILRLLAARTTFLMVGTIEPRKGYQQTLDAFEQLWADQYDLNLVIVGKKGWLADSLADRLRSHPRLNQHIFWLESASDETLEKVYAASTCLIAASEGEGFGLPIIEATQHKLHIIARDIPVFREVAGNHAFYFKNNHSPEALASAIKEWHDLWNTGKAPSSVGMPYLTWKESARDLLDTVMSIVKEEM